MFISFEGIDGAGKTTQLNLYKEYLTNNNVDFISIREPGGTKVSEKIRDILLDKNNIISSKTELLLFEAARNNLVENVIFPALSEGKVVITDRFFDSTTAYQSFGRGIELNDTLNLHKFACNSLVPDKTIFLKISLELSLKRIKNKNKDRMELAGIDFLKRVYSGFINLTKMYPDRISIVNSERDIQTIHQEIVKVIGL
jgi:dTMP kinase